MPWLASNKSKDKGMILLTFRGLTTSSHTILVDCNRRLILDPCPSTGTHALPLTEDMLKQLHVATVTCARSVSLH